MHELGSFDPNAGSKTGQCGIIRGFTPDPWPCVEMAQRYRARGTWTRTSRFLMRLPCAADKSRGITLLGGRLSLDHVPAILDSHPPA